MRQVDPSAPGQPDPQQVALDTLYREYAPSVARWAGRLAGQSLELEDVVQEVFLIAQQRMHSFRGAAKIGTWLYGITENVVRYRRRKERMRRLLTGAVYDHAFTSVTRPTPIEEVERREATATVYGVLDGMRDKYRTPFILFEIDGLSGAEISALTGLNPATVRVRIHRARAQFIGRLGAVDKRWTTESQASAAPAGPARPAGKHKVTS